MDAVADALWSLLANPNVAYILLVFGLWSAVLAVAVPGTGLPETGALIFLGASAIGLAHLPVNWAGVALIGLGVGFFLLELKLATHGAFTLGGFIAFILGSLLLFGSVEQDTGVAVSRWLIAGTSLGTAAFFVFALTRVMASQKLPPAINPNAVVGATGEARTPIDGSGSVYVAGELWSARSDEAIAAGDPVVVVGRQGLTIKVAKVK